MTARSTPPPRPTRAAIAVTGPLATPQRALVFWDAKRPITAALLLRLDLRRLG